MTKGLKGSAWVMQVVALILMIVDVVAYVWLGVGSYWGVTVVMLVGIFAAVAMLASPSRHVATFLVGLVTTLAIESIVGIIVTVTVDVTGAILLATYIAIPLLTAYAAGMFK